MTHVYREHGQKTEAVTDRNAPVANISSQLSREDYNRLDARAKSLGATKGALIRSIVIGYLNML